MNRWIVVVGLMLVGCATPQRTATEPEPGEPRLTVMTYNVNYGLAGDLDTLAAIGEPDADVVCLQETTPAWERVVRAYHAGQYPFMEFHHSQGAGGLAVLSKFPLQPSDPVENDNGWFPGWRVVATTPLGEVQLLLVHLKPPLTGEKSYVSGYLESSDVHLQEITTFARGLDSELPTVVLGDFNESSGGALSYLREQGYDNALPLYAPDADTWRWNTSVGEINSRLDHVVYNGRLEPTSARVVLRGRSDHLPVTVTFVARREPVTPASSR